MTGTGDRLGLKPGMVVQELGWDNDTDDELRVAVEDCIDADMVDGDYGNVVDAVLLWWRADDGDLVDGLVDALTDLVGGAPPQQDRVDHVAVVAVDHVGVDAVLDRDAQLVIGVVVPAEFLDDHAGLQAQSVPCTCHRGRIAHRRAHAWPPMFECP